MGNITVPGYIPGEHSSFSFEISGLAEVRRNNFDSTPPHPLFKSFTRLTSPGERIQALFEELPANKPPLDTALEIMSALSRSMSYRYGHTNYASTAEEALRTGCGVCQDYTHIMLSLCRMAGISARYVSGLMLGEGCSHAWVDVFDGGKWVGLDPTNGHPADDGYIELSHGRDYFDCAPERGVFRGKCDQLLTITATVRE